MLDREQVGGLVGARGLACRRRDVLRAGDLASLAGMAGAGIGASAPAATGFGRARSCLLMFLGGGPSQFETFDPKPEAPGEVRGEFGAIATSVSGLRLGEHLPRLAAQAHRFAIVRSLTHGDGEHGPAVHRMLTGRGLADAGEAPHLASALAARSVDAGGLPFVAVPDYLDAFGPVLAGQGPGPLGEPFAPVVLRANPRRLDVRGPRPDAPEVDRLRRAAAYDREPARLVERYGPGLLGRSALVGRRLVEAGARFVQVNAVRHLDGGWDTHAGAFASLRAHLLPTLDRAASALLADLAASGLLDQTLVVIVGEFGRTPRVNPAGGRDHWPTAFATLVAGARIPGGQVLGTTDATGSEVTDRPVIRNPVNLFAQPA